YDDPAALEALSQRCAAITFEFENVPAAAVARLAELGAEVAPTAKALAIAQDRFEEKSFLNSAGVPTVRFAAVDTVSDLKDALEGLGAPLLLKSRRGGY